MCSLVKGHACGGSIFWLKGCVDTLPGFYCWLPAPMGPKAKAAIKVAAAGKAIKVAAAGKTMKVAPMKTIVKKKGGKQQGEQHKLSKKALESTDLEPLTLDEKIKMMQEANDPKAVTFTTDEWKKLILRFTQTILPKAKEEVKQIWGSVKDKPMRSGKREAQHGIIQAYLLDNSMGERFLSMTRRLFISTQSLEQHEQWVSKKKLLEEMDESEAEDQIACGAVLVRKHPACPSRKQYQIIHHIAKKKIQKVVKAGMNSAAQLDEEQADLVAKSFQHMKMDHRNFGKDSTQMVLGALEDEGDEEEDPKGSSKNKKGSSSKVSMDPKLLLRKNAFLEEVDEETQGEDKVPEDKSKGKEKSLKEEDIKSLTGEDQDAGYNKCSKMASLMDNKILQLKTLLESLKKSLYGTPKAQNNIKDLVGSLGKAKDDLQHMAIHKKTSLKKVKEQLLQGAKLLKESDCSIKATKNILGVETSSIKGK